MRKNREDAEEWLIAVLAAFLAAILSAVLWALRECARDVNRTYRRHGHRRPLVVVAVLCGVALIATCVLAVSGAGHVAAVVGMIALAGWATSVAVLGSIYDWQDQRNADRLAQQQLTDVIGTTWWQD